MKYFNHLKFFPFLIGILLGIFCVFVLKPTSAVIIKFPNLENAGKVVYRDLNGTCFTYSTKAVDCDKNEDKIKPFPLQ